MSVGVILALLAGICGAAAVLQHDARWAGLGVIVLAVALVF